MSTAPVSLPAETAPSMSTPARLLAMLYSPTPAFASLRDRTRWYSFVAPWLVLAVCFAIFGFVVDKKVGYQTVYENQMRNMPKIQAMIDQQPPAQKAAAVKNGIAGARRQGYFTTSLGILIINLIIAGVLLGTFNFGAGAQLSYKTCLAVVNYSYIPVAVKMLIASAMVWFGAVSPDGFLMQNPIATNPAFLLDAAAHPALAILLGAIDLFAIWMLVVAAIGFAALSKMKLGTALTIILGWYLVWALLWTGVAALFF